MLRKKIKKRLLLLVPFYIFSHEKRFVEYERDAEKLGELQEEYAQIRSMLEELAESREISEYVKCTIMDMTDKVPEHIAAKYRAVREGVKAVMGGKVLEYEAKTIKREGIAQGRAEGIAQGRAEGMAQERENGIRNTVSILKNLDIPQQTILTKIQEQYHLDPEMSKKYL